MGIRKVENKYMENPYNTKKLFFLALIFGAIVIGMVIFLSNVVTSESGAPPPGPGDSDGGGSYYSTSDWVIQNGDNVNRSNQTIILDGNLTIEDGGILIFRNVTLIMNCSEDGEFGITVNDGGKFFILDYDDNSETMEDRSNITANNIEYEFKFLVNSGAKFEMKNSELSECGYNWSGEDGRRGLTINTNNTTIENSSFYNNFYGIYFISSNGNIIANNSVYSNNRNGISFKHSDYNSLSSNNCSSNERGISFISSNHNRLYNNTININEMDGVYLDYANHTIFINNTISSNIWQGIRLLSAKHCIFKGNRFMNGGIYFATFFFEVWITQTIETSNTVNRKPVYYFKNTTGITIPSGAGAVILVNCTEIIVENQNLSNGSVGIFVAYSSNITIANNTCFSNQRDGIRLLYSSNSTLINNTCSNKINGIRLSRSDYNIITNNICTNNGFDGIDLFSDHNILTNNTCKMNMYGISITQSSNNTITNNICTLNTEFGIYLRHSDFNSFSYNIISNNQIGIYLIVYGKEKSEGNKAHYNNIYKNKEYGINATNNNGFIINATNNWWGDNTGPYHPTNNTGGKGDTITDYVDFKPWLEYPYNNSKIIYVDDDNTGFEDGSKEHPYNKIQKAIDNATDGDTIRVFEGNYKENIVVDKSLTLIGNGTGNTTIDSEGNGNVVEINSDNVEIFKFFITGSGNDLGDAGIKIFTSNNIISSCNISINDYGISLEDSSNFNTISGCNISNNDYGISLYNSNNFNTISWCNISNNDGDGIRLDDSSNFNTVSYSNISNNRKCIEIRESSNNTISNCNISKNRYGIEIRDSSNNIISGCNISNNDGDGIRLYHSNNFNTISGCNISNNDDDGVRLDNSNNFNTISWCNISNNNRYGIEFDHSSYNTISNNTFTNDGIVISEFLLSDFIQSIENNTVNGKPLLYHKNENNKILNGIEVGQIILVNCSNFEIKNINISKTSVGIEFAFSENNKISDCIISNNFRGIMLYNSSYVIISDCNISNNDDEGIELDYYSRFNTISGSNISNNDGYGIRLYKSSYNTVSDCNISNNDGYGIWLDESSNNIVTDCIISNNDNGGIILRDSSKNNIISNCNISNNSGGIILGDSNNNIVSNCNISNNAHGGIGLHNSHDIRVSNCNISKNSEYGIRLDESSNNRVSNCNISFSDRGIYLTTLGNNNQIINNNIFNNTIGVSLDWSTSNHQIINSTIYNSGDYDFHFEWDSDITAINTSFNKNKIYFGYSSSYLINKWYFSVKVIDYNQNPIKDVKVRINDNENCTYDETYLTNSKGWVKFVDLTEYIKKQNDETFYSPYTISIVDVFINSTEIEIDQNKEITIILDAEFKNWVVTGTEIHINETIILNGNLTIENGGSLTFRNVTLIMNCSENGEFGIMVKDGGKFFILDYDDNSETTEDRSNITAMDRDYEFKFLVDSGTEFVMRNSELSECGYHAVGKKDGRAGLTIKTNYTIIDNSSIHHNLYGIFLHRSSNNHIVNNKIFSNHIGIYLNNSFSNTILECNISNNNYACIYIYYSNNNTISDCNISNDEDYGICNLYSNNNTFSNNIFINNGIVIKGNTLSHFFHTFENNTVNDKQLQYYKNENNKTLNGIEVGQIILVNCSNFDIKNITITNTLFGIEFAFCENITISRCNISLYIYYSNNNLISNCGISNNDETGIFLRYSNNNTFSSCIISNNEHPGIYLLHSANNTFINCQISNNYFGIYLSHSSNNTISACYILNNLFGYEQFDSINTQILNSTISDSTDYDIILGYNSTITIINTTFNKNKIYIDGENTTMTVKWYLSVQVLDKNHKPIPNVKVRIQDNNNGTYHKNFTTDSNGFINWVNLTEYIQNQTTKQYYTPYIINTEKDGIKNTTEIEMDRTKKITIIIETQFPSTDLSISENDITFSNPNPYIGETIQIFARIQNLGEENATAQIEFYDNITLLGSDLIYVPAEMSAIATIVWNIFQDEEGEHTFIVKIINVAPKESNTLNNQASKKITITEIPIEIPDLLVSEIFISKNAIIEDETIRIYATIQNIGTESCTSNITFYQNDLEIETIYFEYFALVMTKNLYIDWTAIGRDRIIKVEVWGTTPIESNMLNNKMEKQIYVNQKPILLKEIPNQTFNEDTIFKNVINIFDYFYDPDGDYLKIIYHGNENVFVEINELNYVSFSAELNWYGIENITFIATDFVSGGRVEETIKVTVNPVNDLLVLYTIDDININEGQTAIIALKADDPDINENNFTFEIEKPFMTIDDRIWIWETNYDDSGTHYITVKVTNGQEYETQIVKITVKNTNRPPEATFYFIVNNRTVDFISKSNDKDNDTLTYYWKFGDGLTSKEENPTHDYEKAGTYEVILKVGDGNINNTTSLIIKVGEVEYLNKTKDSDNDGFTDEFEEQKGTNPFDSEDHPKIKGKEKTSIPKMKTIIVTSAVGLGVILTLFVVGTEIGKFKIFSLLLLPLYFKLTRSDIEKRLNGDKFTVGRIYGFIETNPGATFTRIKKELKFSNSTAAYHLDRLEKLEFIISKRVGKSKFFYALGTKPKNAERIKKLIIYNPGITQKEIIKITRIKQQTVSKNIIQLLDDGKIRMEKRQRNKQYYFIEDSDELKDDDIEEEKIENNVFRNCPFCGKDFELEKTPKFCPFCKDEIK